MRCCLGISLLFNYVLALIGVGACGYGVYLESQANWHLDIFSISVAGWGGLLALISLCYVCGGHRSTCYGCWYSALMTGFAVINAAGVTVYFFKKKEVVKYLKEHAKGADGLLNPEHIGLTVEITLYSVAGVSALMLFAVIVASCHRSHMLQAESDHYGDYALYDEAHGIERIESGRRYAGGASDTSVDLSQQSASQRYRRRYADLYKKYNIQDHSQSS